MSEFRRRLMMAMAQAGVQPQPSYVTDGLVLHLDGIDKGQTPGRWESLVGSAYYTLTEHSTEETNAIVMDGSGAISGTDVPAVNWNSGTIEVCYEKLASGAGIIIYAGSNGIGLCVVSGGYSFGIGAGTSALNQWPFSSPPNLAIVSANNDRLIVNGSVAGGTRVTNNWGSANTACPIGGRTSGTNKYYTNIRIYSIRKYNRLLTEAEMLQNQRVDNLRFNLGLNI